MENPEDRISKTRPVRIRIVRRPVETSPGPSGTSNVGAKRAHSRVEIGTPGRRYRPSRRRRPRVSAAAAASGQALLTAAVPVIVDEAAYPLPPPVDEHRRGAAIHPPTTAGGGIRYHEVLPTDTFQGVCLRYRVTPTELRRANKMLMMTGSDFLKLAPEVLVIPSNGKNSNTQLLDDAHSLRRGPTKGGKIATLVHGASRVVTKDELTHSEAVAYLDMADGDVDRAITSVREDFGWSAEEEKIETVIAGTSGTSSPSSSSSSSSSRIVTTGGDRHRGLT